MSLEEKIKNAKTGESLFDDIPQEEIDRIKKLAKIVWFIHENRNKLKYEEIGENEYIMYFNDMPDDIGVGETIIESMIDLADTLLCTYEEYAECPESELDAGALELREWLLQNLKQPLTN